MNKIGNILVAVGSLAIGLLIIATVSPELFSWDQLIKVLPQLIEMAGSK